MFQFGACPEESAESVEKETQVGMCQAREALKSSFSLQLSSQRYHLTMFKANI